MGDRAAKVGQAIGRILDRPAVEGQTPSSADAIGKGSVNEPERRPLPRQVTIRIAPSAMTSEQSRRRRKCPSLNSPRPSRTLTIDES